MNKRINISRDILFQKYVVEKKSGREIGNELNICNSTIYNYLKKYNIQIRNNLESHKGIEKIEIQRNVLYNIYIIERKSAPDIAKELNVHSTTIYKKLKKYDIKIRNQSECQKEIPTYNFPKEFLYKKYIIEKKSIYIIGKELNVNPSTIWLYLKRYKIPRRTISEATKGKIVSEETKKLMSLNHRDYKGKNHPMYGISPSEKTRKKHSLTKKKLFKEGKLKVWNKGYGDYIRGENNPNWRDGISKLPYAFEFNKELKEFIKKRDNYTCQLCFDRITERRRIKNNPNKKWLTVHHINYNKLDCRKENLITLCHLCNSSVNTKREDWTIYFNNKRKEKIETY